MQKDLDPQGLNKRIILFGFIIDLEIFIDTSEYFPISYAKNYKKLFEHTFTSGNYLQTYIVGGTHAFASSSSGKLYCWGMNDFY